MRRTGRVLFLLLLIASCMMGLWLFQSWREEKISETEQTLTNVYITSVSGSTVQMLAGREKKSYETVSVVTGEAISGVADILLRQNKIVGIHKKPEEVRGKLLKLTDQTIEVEGYGEIPLDASFTVYQLKKDGSVSQGAVTDLVIGETDINFVVAEKKVCAVVLREELPEKIRVILKGEDYSSYDVNQVTVTSDQNYRIICEGEISYHGKGEKTTISAEDFRSLTVVTAEDGGKIRLENFKRRQGTPEYRGTIEIDKQGEALHVINEVPLEEYLYSVVPSEMPTEYSEEALKAQAICARTYAIQQIRSHRMASMGAHVDDSVSYQVYNDLKEDEKSVRAVEDTRGQVVTYKNKIASTYFYSTSCGSSEGTKDVWYTEKNKKYLPAKLLDEKRQDKDLSEESSFKEFIDSAPDTIDSGEAWYRWEAEISAKALQESLEKSLPGRCKANPTQIQVRSEDGTFHPGEIAGVGKIQNIEVKKRGNGGVVSMLEIQGSEAVVQVYTEYNIRTLLCGTDTKFVRKDKREVTGLGILPSGYFYIEKKDKSYVFHGGGYGHGVGMSQTGANVLAGRGKSAEEIISYFFSGTSISPLENAK